MGVRPQQMRDAVLRTKVPSAELWMASFGSVGRSILRANTAPYITASAERTDLHYGGLVRPTVALLTSNSGRDGR